MNIKIKAFTDPLVNRRVCVKGPGYYGGKYIDHCGVVRAVWGTSNVAVQLDGIRNPNSVHGYFYFLASELEVLDTVNINKAKATEKGENTMQKMTNYLNVAKVQFLNTDAPFNTFECANYDPILAAGDICVVANAKQDMMLAEVMEITQSTEAELNTEVVIGVDISDYNARVEKRKRAAELKVKMQERAKQLQDIVLYQTLAKDDPEMAELLKEFGALN